MHASERENTYAYVGGNPLSRIDPLGLEWQFSVGVSVLGGGNPIFVLPGPFGGGGVNVGFTSSGQVFVQFQAEAAVGVGGFFGASFQGGVSHSKRPTPGGISTSRTVQVDANLGFGGSFGGSLSYSPDGDPGASTGNLPGKLGRLGVGYGAAVDIGVVQTTTIATPALW